MKLLNINTRQTSSTNWNIKKQQRHVLEFVLEWKWKKEMKRTRKLMWLELLEMCTPLEGWIGFKMSVVSATWETKNSLKIRLEEKKTQVSLNSLTNLGEVQYSQNQSYYFKDLSLPFIERRTWSQVQRKLTREALKGSLLTLPILAPKREWRGTF